MDGLVSLMSGRFSDEITYVDAASELERVCDWLTSLGIEYSRTRIGRYRTLFTELAEAHRENRIDEFNDKYSFAEFVNAAYERSELVRIFAGLKSLSDAGLIDRLKDALKGHELYVMDNTDRSGRDFSLELSAAARFARQGYRIDFDHEADLKVDMGEFTLYVECKRLKSAAKVERRIKDAIAQLEKRYRSSSSSEITRGLAFFSTGKIVNEELGVLTGPTFDSLGAAAGEINKRFISQFKHLWEKPGRDMRTLGAAVQLDVPARVESGGPLQTLHEVAFHTTTHAMTLDHHRFLRVGEVFRSQDW
ncbi:hypothetical protein [Noviherbaspirillum aridicola]|uniref:Restriction endonuclease n=1 Tax=Noviherbaspirillum aridicola TaxID=2849687 RepID=A0ABQ4QA78_9BURK|nr:hypothetical protein [Noviherbaspirillum aridicola]GIZ54113.1 hypothetical protein NCCP691_41270 [Noviherbaspirillum aridicola]